MIPINFARNRILKRSQIGIRIAECGRREHAIKRLLKAAHANANLTMRLTTLKELIKHCGQRNQTTK